MRGRGSWTGTRALSGTADSQAVNVHFSAEENVPPGATDLARDDTGRDNVQTRVSWARIQRSRHHIPEGRRPSSPGPHSCKKAILACQGALPMASLGAPQCRGALFPCPPRGLCLFHSLLRASGRCWGPCWGAAVGTVLRSPRSSPLPVSCRRVTRTPCKRDLTFW